jgi:CO/xanthine dehydrogenase FAD-binding subunit
MKSFENIDAKSIKEAVSLLQKFQQQKKSAAVVGGGSEYLQLMKDRVVTPDYVINLKTIPGLNYIKEERGGFRIGALATLAELEEHAAVKEKLLILSEAAGKRLRRNPQRRHYCRQYLPATFLLVFPFLELDCLRKGGQVCCGDRG